MSTFNLPDLGEGLREAEIVAWHVAEGDHVVADQPLLSVETDKAVVEIPAPVSGTVSRLLAEEGAIVPTGGPLAEITTEGAADTGAIVGDLGTPALPADRAATPRPAAATATMPRVSATPAVRKLAREHGVDLGGITGTGPGGVIQTSDILAAAGASAPGEELRGVRRAMAQAMAGSHAVVVPATVFDHADIAAWGPDEDPMLRLIHATVAACKAEPALNAWFDGTRRQLFDHVDLAIAVDTPEGLFAPVLRDAGGASDIAARLAALKAGVRDRTIAPKDLKGATVTLSNFGTIGGQHAVLVVSPPQVAILGAGRIQGESGAQARLPLSLTFDHRVVTGGEAARFLAAVEADLARPSLDAGG